MQFLGTDQVAAKENDRLPASVLIAAQSVLDQRDGSIADPTSRRSRPPPVVARCHPGGVR